MQAMRQSVRVGSTMLAGTNKAGVLKPDSQGYYPCPVGAYNSFNSGGFLYDEKSGVAMFTPGSQLMRQVEKGVLYGEFKHPELQPGMRDSDYIARIRKVDPDRWSHHIREYELVPSTDEQGRPITMVIAWLKPFGPFGEYVEASLKNPAQNTYFSVRSITITWRAVSSSHVKSLPTTSLVKAVFTWHRNIVLRLWKISTTVLKSLQHVCMSWLENKNAYVALALSRLVRTIPS